jgi:integral membrane sensor domain MASE1
VTEPTGDFGKSPVRLLYKIIAYVVVWILALVLTAPGLWPLAWRFPVGLVAVIDRHMANAGGWGVLIACYAVYLAHSYFYFRSKTTTRTVILYGVLVILLIGNVAGCRDMMRSH